MCVYQITFNFIIITELRNGFTELYMKNFGRHTLSSIPGSATGMERSAAYEAAALQALLALQDIYGFVVLDYNIHGLIVYRTSTTPPSCS